MNADTIALLDKHFDLAINAPDGIKRLRETILTLAMQGKLVPQDPKDQPASELLKDIEAEKQRLVKEGKIKEPKPLPPIKPDEVPYELPKSWEWVRLGEFALYNGRLNVDSDIISKDAWILDLEDIEKNTSRLLYRARYEERQSKSNKSIFCKGDVLYGKLRPYLDKVLVANEDGYCTTEIVPIVPLGEIDPFYLRWILKRPSFIQLVNSLSYGVKMPRLGTEDAINSVHPLPPLAEQRRIVAKIDELMARVDEIERKRDARNEKRLAMHQAAVARLLDAGDVNASRSGRDFIFAHFGELYGAKENVAELRKAILQLAVMGRLVPQDQQDQPASELLKEIETEKKRLVQEGKIKEPKPLPPIKPEEVPYQVPKGWEWVRLGDISSLITKGSSPTWQGVNYSADPEDILFITSENVGSYSLILDKKKYVEKKFNQIEPRSILKKGDFLMNIVGASIGRTAIYQEDFIANINQAVCLIRCLLTNLNAKYLLNFFNTPICIGYMFDKQVENARANLSMSNIARFLIPLPPLAEQRRIVAKVDELMALCDKLDKQIDERTAKESALLEAVAALV